MSNAVLASL
jgi:hypothetical protein